MQMLSLNGQPTRQGAAMKRGPPLRKRILLADDQPSVREAIHLLLNLDKHTVIEAANGAEAIALFKGDHFDLVITDFEMPNMKGSELAEKIKQLSPAQPILMITAYAERLGDSANPRRCHSQ